MCEKYLLFWATQGLYYGPFGRSTDKPFPSVKWMLKELKTTYRPLYYKLVEMRKQGVCLKYDVLDELNEDNIPCFKLYVIFPDEGSVIFYDLWVRSIVEEDEKG